MSDTITVEGIKPLMGTVKLSGSKNSVLKLIPAAMFCNEDVVLENVPKVAAVLADLEIIRELGGKAEWAGENRLVLNGSGLKTYEIPFESGSKFRTVNLLVPVLVFRFGMAHVPKTQGRPINRLIETWRKVGMFVDETDSHYVITVDQLKPANINFKVSSHMGTDNAILCSMFLTGQSIITNAAEEPEVDDLISFCNLIGADISRVESRKIVVNGTNVFRGATYEVINDRYEAVMFAVAAYITNGNVTIKSVDKTNLGVFVSVLSKIDCKFEFVKDEMRVWRVGETLTATDIVTAPTPGFVTDWQPLITLLLLKSQGESIIHDTVYTDRFDYVKELNRMGAGVDLVHPSDVGLQPVISDDNYDFNKLGEPLTVIKISGFTKLKGTKINILDGRSGASLLVAALGAEGKSEISGIEIITSAFENILEKLKSLGAIIN